MRSILCWSQLKLIGEIQYVCCYGSIAIVTICMYRVCKENWVNPFFS